MKTVVMIFGLLLLGAMAYFGYSYGTQKSTEVSMEQDNEVVVQKIKSVQTEVVEEPNEERIEADIAVKSSIVEEIPSEEMENVAEEEELSEEDQAPEGEDDIIENEDSQDGNVPEDIDKIVEEQEALMDEVIEDEHGLEKIDKEEFEKNKHIKSFSSTKKDEMKVEQDLLPPLETETEEEKIIREEEAMTQAAINEDNISE